MAIDLQSLYTAQGAQTRSRVKWIEEGEKNSKYFLGLEKSRGSNKVITRLKDDEGNTYTQQDDLLDFQVKYHKDIYSKKVDFEKVKKYFDEFCNGIQIPCLDDEAKFSCEGLIESDEAEFALLQLRKDSAPGYDGLTGAFYSQFWPQIKDLVINSFNEAFDLRQLSISQRRAIITLIHKGKDLPREDLGNWRPISLTNFDYKILAKVLANRFKVVINDIIDEDQTAYIRGRNITTIVRLIDDVIEYVEVNNETGAILALDYRKAFDSISKEYLIECFKIFGFGDNFIQWVETLMSGTESSIIHYGWISEFFPVNAGVRQGCPFACVAFILGVEILAIKIRQSPNIKGIRIPGRLGNVQVKIQLYADDNTLFPSDQDDIHQMLKVVNDFSRFSGLHLNMEKTDAMWIGKSRASLSKVGDIKWHLGRSMLKILGVYFSNYDRASNLELNWSKRIDNIIRIIKSWDKRNLSIIGKVVIVKTFLISQFSYLLQALIFPEPVLKSINTILFRFLWKKQFSNRRAFEKVKRDVLCLDYNQGGLKMINIFDMQNAYIIKWFRYLFDKRDSLVSQIPLSLYGRLGTDLSTLNSSVTSKEFKGLGLISSQFWRQAFKVWIDNNTFSYEDGLAMHPYNQVIWNNTNIRYKHNVLMWENWCPDFVFINDLFLDDQFVSLEQVQNSLGKNATVYFQYFALINAIPAEWKSPQVDDLDILEPTFGNEKVSQLSTKSIRLSLLKKREKLPHSVSFWKNRYNGIDVMLYFKVLFNATKETRLRTLQWKILHNIYPTNILLYKMGKSDSSNCNHCNVRDFIEHFFCNCIIVRNIWIQAEAKIVSIIGYNFILTEIHKLFGVTSTDVPASLVNSINYIILIVKMCISKFKYGRYHDIVLLFEHELKLRSLL